MDTEGGTSVAKPAVLPEGELSRVEFDGVRGLLADSGGAAL
ncbi:hypothetical protein [Streptomyces sp. NPDC054854]